MRAQFINKLVSQPWNISRTQGRTIIGSMISMLLKSDRPAQDIFGDPLPVMQVRGDIAIIPIVGRLLVNVPDGFKSYGFNMTDVNDIEIEIDSALNNSSVRIIVTSIIALGGFSPAHGAGKVVALAFSSLIGNTPLESSGVTSFSAIGAGRGSHLNQFLRSSEGSAAAVFLSAVASFPFSADSSVLA